MDSDAQRIAQIGMRNPADQERMHTVGGITIALVADPDICLQRIDTSNPKNPTTVGQYLAAIETETSVDQYGSNTGLIIERATYVIDTSATLEESHGALREIVDPLLLAAT